MELAAYGWMLRLKWHCRNDKKELDRNKFKLNSSFNPRKKDAAIEKYLSRLEEKLMSIEIPQNKYSNLTLKFEKWQKHCHKNADKGCAVVAWNSDDHIKEAEKQLGDKDIYEVCNDPGPLISTTHKAIEKIRKRDDLNTDTIEYFMVKTQNLLAFTWSRKYMNNCMMFQIDLLFQTAVIVLKTYLPI